MKKRFLLLFTLILTGSFIRAQSPRQVTTRYLAWGGLLEQFTFSDRLNASFDNQYRYEYTDNDWFVMIFRPGLTYVTKNKILLTGGGGYILLYPNPNDKPARREWRAWEEIGKKFKTKGGTFFPRIRYEQRFIREYNGTALQDDFSFNSHRFRLRCDWTLPLKSADKGIFLIAGNEYFYAIKPNGFAAFDQNRAYAGGGYRFSKTFALQVQYLNLYVRTGVSKYEMHHTARLTVLHEFDFRKKEPQQ